MKQLTSQEKTKEACIEWSSKYISVYEEVAKSPIADFKQLGIFSWSDQFIWCSTHCQINLNIKDEGFHTFAQAQESSFLSVYTLLIQHTFQILESFDISAPEAAFNIPNFFERHFDYISMGIASQSSGWNDEEKDSVLMRKWIGTKASNFLANSNQEISTTDSKHIWERGVEKYNQGDIEGALSDFRIAVELDPSNPFFLNSLGVAEYDSNNHQQADQALSKALEISPNDHIILNSRAKNNLAMFREHEALIDINKALQSSPHNLFSRYLRAQIQLALENYHEALLDLDTFIEAYPELAHARYLRARTLDEDLDDPEKALPDIEVAVSVESEIEQYHVLHGEILLELEKNEEAISAFTKALNINEHLGWALEQRSNAHQAIGNYAEAIADLTVLIEEAKTKDRFIEMRAKIYLDSGDLDLALIDINQSFTNKGTHDFSKYEIRSKIYSLLGDEQTSFNDHEIACKLKLERSESWICSYPNEAWPFDARAMAWSQLGEKEKARLDWLKAIELDPESKDDYLFKMQADEV